MRKRLPECGLARHDNQLLAAARCQAANIVRITGENPVSRTGNEHDGRIDRIIGTCLGEERAPRRGPSFRRQDAHLLRAGVWQRWPAYTTIQTTVYRL